jgi:hypothetical protein
MTTQSLRGLALLIGVVIIVLGLSIAVESQPVERQAGEEKVPELSLKALAENPGQYLGKTFRVTGKLRNIGENYFTDLRVILEDDKFNFFYVRPWLPLEFPPTPPGHSDRRRPVLSQYLGQQVELTTALERGTLKKVGEVYFLSVKSAKILK